MSSEHVGGAGTAPVRHARPSGRHRLLRGHVPRWSRRDARGGPLVNVTNDGWYKDTWGPYQHFGANVMRAIETRMTVIRPGNTGISAVIDPYGMVTARLDLNVRGRLDAEVPLTDAFPERSFYVRHGDWFGSISMVLFALAALLRLLPDEAPSRLSPPI